MTTKDVDKIVEKISDSIGDDEAAHGLEDKLYVEVLQYIARTKYPVAKLAQAALKANDLKFHRWLA